MKLDLCIGKVDYKKDWLLSKICVEQNQKTLKAKTLFGNETRTTHVKFTQRRESMK